MLTRALLQTSLLLWFAQQTLQGGVKPQSVSWGRVLPARGVGIGVKPGVAGALGALGSRYGSKVLKNGVGRHSGAHLGAGGYRALGLGGRAGGYGTPGAYGAGLGTGLGTGLTNGLGLGLGQGAKRVYGGGLGTLPGYGSLAGVGYPGARPGASADSGGQEIPELGQQIQDLMGEKKKLMVPLYGRKHTLEAGPGGVRSTTVLGATAPDLQTNTGFGSSLLPPGGEVKSLDPVGKSSSLGHMTPFDKQSKILAQARLGGGYVPTVSGRGAVGPGAALVPGGVRQKLPGDKDDIKSQPNPWAKNCRSAGDPSSFLGSESFGPQDHVGEDKKAPGPVTQHAQEERLYQPSSSQNRRFEGSIFSLSPSQVTRNPLAAAADQQRVRDLLAEDTNAPRIRGTVENHRSALNPQPQQGRNRVPAVPGTGTAQGWGSIPSMEGQEDVTADVLEEKRLPKARHEVTKPKALSVPGHSGKGTQAPSYVGGAGNYPGAGLGPGGYGAGLGQGAYLGATAGKLGAAGALGPGGYPQAGAGLSPGYSDGATGYLGAVAGNGFGGDAAKAPSAGYGNGYSDGYGAGLGYPAELADGAESKAGKRKALGAGAYAGQVNGAYGALGAGLDSTGGKYGGGAHAPFGNTPVIPTGVEGDGGYPFTPQQLALSAEGAKTAGKYGAGERFGTRQTGFGAQFGVTQDALGEQAGKYGGVNEALGYKG